MEVKIKMGKYDNAVNKNKKKQKKRTDFDKINNYLGSITSEPLNYEETSSLMKWINQLSETGNYKVIIDKVKTTEKYEHYNIKGVHKNGAQSFDKYIILCRRFFPNQTAFIIVDEDEKLVKECEESVFVEKEIFGDSCNDEKFFKYFKIKDSFDNPDLLFINKLREVMIKKELLMIDVPETDTDFIERFEKEYGLGNILWMVNDVLIKRS